MMRHYALLSTGLLLVAMPAMASSKESAHEVTLGAGIASPSVTSALVENGAGLVYAEKITAMGAAGTNGISTGTSGGPTDMVFTGEGVFGNGTLAAGVGVQYTRVSYSGATTTSGSSTSELDEIFGAAALIKSLNIALGLNGTYSNAVAGTGSGLTLHPGLLINPEGRFRFGFVTDTGLSNYGLGIATDLDDSTTFALDVGTTSQFAGASLKPSIGFHASTLQATIGYGFQTSSATPAPYINSGVSFGLGKSLGSKVELLAYYNQFGTYFVGLSSKF